MVVSRSYRLFVRAHRDLNLLFRNPQEKHLTLATLLWIFLCHVFNYLKVKVLVTQSCLTFCNPMDCTLPGSSVHGILQARILGWVAIPFSRESFQPRDGNWVSHTAGRLYHLSHQ